MSFGVYMIRNQFFKLEANLDSSSSSIGTTTVRCWFYFGPLIMWWHFTHWSRYKLIRKCLLSSLHIFEYMMAELKSEAELALIEQVQSWVFGCYKRQHSRNSHNTYDSKVSVCLCVSKPLPWADYIIIIIVFSLLKKSHEKFSNQILGSDPGKFCLLCLWSLSILKSENCASRDHHHDLSQDHHSYIDIQKVSILFKVNGYKHRISFLFSHWKSM